MWVFCCTNLVKLSLFLDQYIKEGQLALLFCLHSELGHLTQAI